MIMNPETSTDAMEPSLETAGTASAPSKAAATETVGKIVDGFRKVLPGQGSEEDYVWYTKHAHGEGR